MTSAYEHVRDTATTAYSHVKEDIASSTGGNNGAEGQENSQA